MSEDLLFAMSDKACVRAWEDEGWGPVHRRLLTMCVAREHNGWKRKTGMTQNDKIMNHIKLHGSISQREAYIDYSVQSFTKRIAELRAAGWNIVKERRRHPTTGQMYSRYYLRELAVAA